MVDGDTTSGQGAAGTTGGAAGGQGGQGATPAGSYTVPNTSASGGSSGAARGGRDDNEARDEFVSVHVAKLVRRYGTLENALDVLAADLYERREQDRLNPRPPAGAVVLVGDDVKAWQGYQGLGLPPDKVKEALAERDTLRAKDSATTQGTVNQQAVEAVGWKDPQALGELLTAKGLQLDMRDVQVVKTDGTRETKRMPYVRKNGDTNAAWEPLADAVNTHHKVWLPALTAEPQGGNGTNAAGSGPKGGQGATSGARSGNQQGSNSTAGNGTQGGAAATRVVVSSGQATGDEGATQGGSLVDRRLARNKAAASAPNALRPAPKT